MERSERGEEKYNDTKLVATKYLQSLCVTLPWE